VEIDRIKNTFDFEGWSYQIFYIPYDATSFKGSRTMPFSVENLFGIFAGDSAGLITDENGNRLGVDEFGNVYEEIPNATARGLAMDGANGPMLVGLPFGNYKIDMVGSNQSGNYSNYFFHEGVVYGMENVSSEPGTKDHLSLVFEDNNPMQGMINISTEGSTKTFSVKIIKEFGNNAKRVYRIINSDLYEGDNVIIGTTPDDKGIILTNRGSHTLTYDVEVSTSMVAPGFNGTELPSIYEDGVTIEPMTTRVISPESWLNLSQQEMNVTSFIYGDGLCSEGENHLNCPEDCPEEVCVVPYDDMMIDSDTKLCHGNYTINDRVVME